MQIGISVSGVELEPTSHATTSAHTIQQGEATSHPIFLIGMRGAGKTYIGGVVAEVLGGEYTDADDVFSEQTKLSVSDFVAANDWAAFRQTETRILKEFVQEKKGNHVIGLGGGIVETPEARDVLTSYIRNGGAVVHITREMGDIEGYLDSIGSTATRPNWGEGFDEVWKRRQPWYSECSSHEFFNTLAPVAGQSEEDHHTAVRGECERFFKFITGRQSNRPVLSVDNPTTFLSLTFPDITPALEHIDELTEGADAIELRVDLLSPSGKAPAEPQLPPREYVAKQLSLLRLATSLPIVYSVRSKDQGGMAPSNDEKGYLNLVTLGLRSGCEYVDLEVCWKNSILDSIVGAKGTSHIVASWHDWTGNMAWNGKEVKEKYDVCAKYGDVVKIVGTAKTMADNYALATFAEEQNAKGGKPFLAINMGAKGQMSRISNPILTPITHPLLPSRAAPGQLSAKEINTARGLMGYTPRKRFFLFGSPIAASVSPTLHNTGFETLGLPHFYDRYEASTIDDGLKEIIGAADFGGASVTIPLKLDIIPLLDSVSPDAKLIGAVNTIVPRVQNGKQVLTGENTDWQAIAQAAKTHLSTSSGPLVGLVIGAGGTCRAAIYALHQLGASTILLFNRTLENAQKVKDSFPAEYNIEVTTSLSSLSASPAVVVSTVPGDSLTATQGGEGIYVDAETVLGKKGGVVIDMAYKPYKTALLSLAETRNGWKNVSGVEILCLQGYVQFELWTGKKAPREKIRKAVMDKYFASS